MTRKIQVPLFDLKTQYAELKSEIEPALREVIESQHFILGPQVDELEKEIADYCQARHAIGCASGSDALLLALMAYDIGPGDEVICPSYTFFATAGAIARLGARPVFIDIEPTTYNLDIAALEKAIASCTQLKAIIPVHLYGQAVDLDAVIALANKARVPVIEDAAQAIGATDARGIRVGVRGAIGCFSFFPTKNLGGFGDGGIVTTQDETLAQKLKILRVHGMEPKYYHSHLGINSRLDALQATVLRVKLRHLDRWHHARQKNAAFYDRFFLEAGAQDTSTPLAQNSKLALRIPKGTTSPATHIYNQYVIRVPSQKRDALRTALAENGIGTEIYYPVPLHQQECFAYLGYKAGSLPESEAAARETIALPIFPELTQEQLEHVAQNVVAFLHK